MRAEIIVLPGDGIGPEVASAAVRAASRPEGNSEWPIPNSSTQLTIKAMPRF